MGEIVLFNAISIALLFISVVAIRLQVSSYVALNKVVYIKILILLIIGISVHMVMILLHSIISEIPIYVFNENKMRTLIVVDILVGWFIGFRYVKYNIVRLRKQDKKFKNSFDKKK